MFLKLFFKRLKGGDAFCFTESSEMVGQVVFLKDYSCQSIETGMEARSNSHGSRGSRSSRTRSLNSAMLESGSFPRTKMPGGQLQEISILKTT